MAGLDQHVEYLEKQEQQWEVSLFDIANCPVYIEWVGKLSRTKGLPKDAAETVAQDPNHRYAAIMEPPRNVLQACLFSLGMDIKENMERQNCYHRTFSGTKIHGDRYVGTQRTDDVWKKMVRRIQEQ